MTPGLANARHAVAQSGSAATAVPLSREAAMRGAMQALRRQMLAGAQNVGREFAAQARQMHDGEIDTKAIYGQANRDEVVSLLEDGVPVLPLPPAPEEQH